MFWTFVRAVSKDAWSLWNGIMVVAIGAIVFWAERHPTRLGLVKDLFGKKKVIRTYVVIVTLMVFVSCYRVWVEEVRLRKQAQAFFTKETQDYFFDPTRVSWLEFKLLRNQPQLVNGGTEFLLTVHISNDGKPTTLSRFSLNLIPKNSQEPIVGDLVPDKSESAFETRYSHQPLGTGYADKGNLRFFFARREIADYVARPDVNFELSAWTSRGSIVWRWNASPSGEARQVRPMPTPS